MQPLSSKRCTPCEGGVKPLTRDEAEKLMREIPLWKLREDGGEIVRTFLFKDFYETMGFVNALAYLANREGHHPDLEVGYGRCVVRYHTHAIGGLSQNDFICAAKINRLLGVDETEG